MPEAAQIYNDPAGGDPSSIGPQIRTDHYIKESLIEARKLQFFTQLAEVTPMPKNMGKRLKKNVYLPLLDDRNINDQGIDASGAVITNAQWFVSFPDTIYAANADKGTAVSAINANTSGVVATAGADNSAGTGLAEITLANGTTAKFATEAAANAVIADVPGAAKQQGSGNLYGSSKDIGAINGKLPTLTENGGRVNRVGFKRELVESSLEKLGFFDEYTQESMDFDTDAELMTHINREMVNGAVEMSEDMLQIDLLTRADTLRLAGGAGSVLTMTDSHEVTYGDLLALSITLDNLRCPKQTKIITGTRLVDTRTIAGGRVMYIGSELLPLIEAMKDLHGNQAFIPVHKYAAGSTLLNGEVGSVSHFRIVVVPEMMKWAGAGADASGTDTHYETNGRYDVFPMLVVGDGAFSTVGFQTDGQVTKFKITHQAPGKEAADRNDPFGETGFMSIKWYYGYLPLREERLAVLKTTAPIVATPN
jgi:N4-gp56 family major capsid protein